MSKFAFPSSVPVQPVQKEKSMSISRFKAAKQPRKIKFVGQDLEIVKLTVAEAIEIQTSVSEAEASEDPESNLKILLRVIQFGAPELKEMTLEDLKEFPMQ